ncbi:MAG: selenocysteine-specific translation elongation factor [Beijerinckiaceae bacterium]
MIIGTAGHIDHGKTSLVRAITGVDADRLKEEKARGITIDLGFAYWPQADGSRIGFVDVPGHEGYIHNMLAGITGIDALLFVVAANEGIKPQTLEHLLIADLLGIKQGVVALTKADLCDAGALAARNEEIRLLLAATGLSEIPIVPVSIVSGEGLGMLEARLRALASSACSHRDSANQPFRMPIDRAFTLQGAGTIVTGSIRRGSMHVDDRLILSPSGAEVRVRGIHAQNLRVDHASIGTRAAVNLAGISKDEAERGDVLVAPELHAPTLRFDASIRLAPEITKSLPVWSPVHLHCGSGSWPARLVPLVHGKQVPDHEQPVQIVLSRPAALFAGDRLILRDASASRTIGGGTILDVRAPERNRRKPERLEALAVRARDGGIEALPHLAVLPPYALDIEEYARDHGQDRKAFDAVIARENLLLLRAGPQLFVMAPAILLRLARHMIEHLKTHHETHPDQAGLTTERLRLAVPERLSAQAFAAVVEHCERRGDIASTGAWLRLPHHVPRLSPEHEALWALVRPRISGQHRFTPPRLLALSEDLRRRQDTIRGLMKRLARRGDVHEVAQDHFLLRTAVAELAEIAARTGNASHESGQEGWFNAALFRDQLAIGRKMAILVLEFFDRQGLTIRKGDLRRIDPRKVGLFKEPSKPHQPTSTKNL